MFRIHKTRPNLQGTFLAIFGSNSSMPYCGVPINCNAFITALAPDVDTFHKQRSVSCIYIYRIRIELGPKSDDCFTLCSENERIARYTRGSSDQSSATDLRRPKNDDCYTLCSRNERIARYTRHGRAQTRSGSSTSERKRVSVV